MDKAEQYFNLQTVFTTFMFALQSNKTMINTKTFKLLIAFIFSCTILTAQEKKFTLLHTSDEHSTLLPLPLTEYEPGVSNPSVGGFARLATKVKEIRANKASEPVVLLSAGDIMGGSPFAWLILQGFSIELELMNKIGYTAMTIGNHEFDYGPDILTQYLQKGGYSKMDKHMPNMSIIAANLNIPKGNVLNSVRMQPYQIKELPNGIKLGILGILGDGAYQLAPAAGEVTIFDQFITAQKYIDILKKEGADVVVMLSHSGIVEDREMAKKLKNLDVILGGHDHIKTEKPEVINGVIVVHPSYYLQHVGMLEFSFDSEKKKLELLNEKNGTSYLQVLGSDVVEDPEIAAIISSYTDSLNQFLSDYTNTLFQDINSSVISSDFPVKKEAELKETSIGNFVADAMRIRGSVVTGDKVDFAFQGNGVIRAEILPGARPSTKGKFALFDLLTIVGLGSGPDNSPGYPMVSVYLTAKEIFNILEVTAMLSQVYADNFFLQVSGLKYTYDPGKSMWGRIPVKNLPIPATMAVKSVHLYKGEGFQTQDGDYIELTKESEGLYHVVTDYYLAAFLPMVGELLPKLEILFKNKEGQVVNIDDCIVKSEGKEYKIWEAVAEYANELKQMPTVYQQPADRITEERGIPLYVWTITALVLIVIGLFLGIRKMLKWKRG